MFWAKKRMMPNGQNIAMIESSMEQPVIKPVKQPVFIFFILFCALSFGKNSVATQRPAIIKNIHIDGLAANETNELKAVLGLMEGRAIDPFKIRQGLKNLKKTNKYSKLQIEQKNVGENKIEVVIRVMPRTIFGGWVFENILAECEQDIRELVSIQVGDVVPLDIDDEIRRRLARSYEWLGYLGIKVSSEFIIQATGYSLIKVSVTNAERTTIARIDIKTDDKVRRKEILSVIKLGPGDVATRESIEESISLIREYLTDEQYLSAEVKDVEVELSDDKKQVNLLFVVDWGVRSRLEFKGIDKIAEIDLRKLLSKEILSETNGHEKAAAIFVDYYKSLGFCRVKVDAKLRIEGKEKIVLSFQIEEGFRVRIDGHKFKVVDGGDGKNVDLKNAVLESSPPAMARGLFVEAEISVAAENTRKNLESKGYLVSNVLPPKIIFSADGKGVTLIWDIEVGIHSVFGKISFVGLEDKTFAALKSETGWPEGQNADMILLKALQDKTVFELQKLGYAEVVVKQSLKTQDGNSGELILNVVFEVVLGSRFLVGNIEIFGNLKTLSEIIIRELPFKPGDAFSIFNIQQAERKLRQLGLFSRVDVLPVSSTQNSNIKDIRIEVRENKPGTGELGVGANFEDPRFRIRLFQSLQYRNLFGRNQTALIRNEVGIPFDAKRVVPFVEYASLLSYRAPEPWSLPFSFVSSLSLDRFELVAQNAQIQTRGRFDGRIEKKLRPKLTGFLRFFRYELARTEILGVSSSAVEDVIGSLGPGFILDQRNDPFNPSQGSLHTLEFEYADSLLGSRNGISFLLGAFKNSVYSSIMAPLIWSFHAGFGAGYSLNSQRGLPTSRRINDLALGGQSSIRGFSTRRFSADDNIQSTAYYNFRVESALPLTNELRVALFFDTGQIFPDFKSKARQGRHDGVGAGLRYLTPVGPVAIDVAQGLGEDAESIKFYFTVGTF